MADSIDYYDPAPLIRLDRPTCLVGLPGSGSGRIARMIALVSGLPLTWLDRGVEHRAGAAIDQLVLEQGAEVRTAHERELLPDTLRRTPAGVIALSEATLSDPRLRDLVRATATLVYVRRPVAALTVEIQRARAKRPGAYARLGGADIDLVALVATLDPMLRRLATVVVEVGHAGPQASGRAVVQALGWQLPTVWEAPSE